MINILNARGKTIYNEKYWKNPNRSSWQIFYNYVMMSAVDQLCSFLKFKIAIGYACFGPNVDPLEDLNYILRNSWIPVKPCSDSNISKDISPLSSICINLVEFALNLIQNLLFSFRFWIFGTFFWNKHSNSWCDFRYLLFQTRQSYNFYCDAWRCLVWIPFWLKPIWDWFEWNCVEAFEENNEDFWRSCIHSGQIT